MLALALSDRIYRLRFSNEQVGFVAKNTGEGTRKGAVRERVQAYNPVTERYVKIDTNTGRIIEHKKSEGPYKGVREVKPKGR